MGSNLSTFKERNRINNKRSNSGELQIARYALEYYVRFLTMNKQSTLSVGSVAKRILWTKDTAQKEEWLSDHGRLGEELIPTFLMNYQALSIFSALYK